LRKNLLLFGIEEYPHGSYFSTLTIRGNIEFEMRVDILKWHIYSVRRLGKGTGGRSIPVKLTSFRKKLEMLPTTRNLAAKNIRIEQDYNEKIKEAFRDLFPYLNMPVIR
jgi:hypothetical protein